MLGAAILAGCELGLLLAEMVGDDAAGLGASTATCAAVSAARVLDLRGGRLVSAIGIGASSSVGAAAAQDAAWRAGKSASNGVLAALLAEAGFTGPADAIEHPRGLLGAVFDVPPAAGTAAGFGNRIGLMKTLVFPATQKDGLGEKVAGMWEMGRASELVAAVVPDRMRR
jgi:2-methylcitrate dehydratase PrpD